MTEGNGHVIDQAGQARRVLQAAVAEYGPQALSNAVIMDRICQARLSDLPGEAILIGSAARADVPAMLREQIPRLGNYGAIRSVAASLAQAHSLDTAASVWVVREFARALGLIASGSGGTQTTTASPAAPPAAVPPAAVPPAAVPPGPGGVPPRRKGSGSRVLNRNTVGVAAAIALVAGYLGVAAAAHLSPFPAKAAPTTSPPASQGPSTSPSPAASPDPTPDPPATSDYQMLLSKIPAGIQGSNNCLNAGTEFGSIAESQCSRLSGGANIIIYYLYPSTAALGAGMSSLLKTKTNVNKQRGCTTNNKFTDFITDCESQFTSASPSVTGSVAEYVNTNNQPIIVSSDNRQHVMAVLVGTNDGDLLAYWKQLTWIVP